MTNSENPRDKKTGYVRQSPENGVAAKVDSASSEVEINVGSEADVQGLDSTAARSALDEISIAARRARNISLFKGADLIYMIWGLTWIICFVSEHFMEVRSFRLGPISMPIAQLVWMPACIVAIILSIMVFRKSAAVKSPYSKAYGIFWVLLFVYAYLWLYIFSPIIRPDSYALSVKVTTAFFCTIPMFAYVVMGLFGGGIYMTWLGLGITAMTCVGLAVAGQWFYLWMAFFGGGTLFVTGVITRLKWSRSCQA